MSSIEKLLIRGIRSFSPDSQNVIEFYTPVTIIVGHNGAGKTTVIECLKYATTGDLPPNAKGGAFVHDPKLSGDGEVKAQIRLKFRNVRGQSMVVTRSLQSSQKKNSKLEQKSLEGLLVTVDPATGEQVSISTRCAELDTEIPLHLGVSRAVLENVIFCHQEESFWPLSEPGVLKKKFDDIFAATRYTKALETLKSLRKELTADLRLETQKLQFLQSEQEKGRRVEASLAACERQIEELRGRVSSLDLQIEAVSATIDRSADDLQALNLLCSEVERLEHDIANTKQARSDLLLALTKHYQDLSSNELNQMLEQLLADGENARRAVEDYEAERNQLLGQIESLTRDYSRHCTRRGALESQLEMIQGKRAARQRILKKLGEMFSLSSHSVALEDLMRQVGEKIQAQRDRLAEMKSELSSQDASRQHQIQLLLSRHAGCEELHRSRRKQIEEIQEAQVKLEEQLAAVNEDVALNDDFQEEMELASEETELAMARETSLRSKGEAEKLTMTLQEERKSAEVEQDCLQGKLNALNQFSDVRARLALKIAECSRREEALQRALNDFRAQDKDTSSFEQADREFEEIQRQRMEKLKSAQELKEQASQSLASLTSRFQHTRQQLQRREGELAVLQTKMASGLSKYPGINGMNLEGQIKRLEQELAQHAQNEALARSSAAVFTGFLQDLHDSCPLCERSFEDPQQLVQLQAKLQDKAQQSLNVNQHRNALEAQLCELIPLKSLHEAIDGLRAGELPELRGELDRLEEEEAGARVAHEEALLNGSSLSVEERRGALIKRKIDEGLRLSREFQNCLQERHQLESALPPELAREDEGGILGLQEASLTAQGRARRALERLTQVQQEMCQVEIQMNQREGALRDRREALLSRRLKRSEVDTLRRQLCEQQEALSRCQTDLARLQEEGEEIARSLNSTRSERESWLKEMQAQMDAAQSALDGSLVPFSQLDSLQADLERIEAEGNCEEELGKLSRAAEECERAIREGQGALQSLQESHARSNREASSFQLHERNLRDNLKERELGLRVEQLEGQLMTRKGRLEGFDRISLQSGHSKAQLRRSDLMGERAGLVGEGRQLEEQAGRLRQELSVEFSQVTQDWQCQVIKTQALQLASDDLEKYARALDQAIMKYHAVKMDEINSIIRELWTATYQGSDIDTVEIRADHETTTGNTTALTGRSYNYRVIMKRGAVELDMRGRSSAGQRVLTCLIIRLALSEVFGLHCGILALDEPTTNLDRDNIAGLAAALAQLIRTRRSQSNFQLILITHDEEFVQLLGRFECAEYYWRVFRDENLHSAIERQSISGVLT